MPSNRRSTGSGGLLVFDGDRLELRNRERVRRDWLRRDYFEASLLRLADALPILWRGTAIDGELVAGRFQGTMAALHGSLRFRKQLRFVAFDVPFLAGLAVPHRTVSLCRFVDDVGPAEYFRGVPVGDRVPAPSGRAAASPLGQPPLNGLRQWRRGE